MYQKCVYIISLSSLLHFTLIADKKNVSLDSTDNYQVVCRLPSLLKTIGYVISRVIAIKNFKDQDTRVVPKLMPPIYFHGNYTRYKEHNNTI